MINKKTFSKTHERQLNWKASIGANGSDDTIEEEKYVIGVAIENDECRSELFSILKKPSMFTLDIHRVMWAILLEMNSIGKPIEEITVLRELKNSDSKQMNLNSYKSYMDRGSAKMAIENANYIYANFCVREVKKAAKKIYAFQTVSVDEVKSFLIRQVQLTEELGKLLPSTDNKTSDTIEKAEKSIYTPDEVIPFPIDSLNKASGGITRGHMTIIGGRTGHGKTTTLANLVDGWLKQGYKIRWYSREQSATEMLKSCILLNSNVDRKKVRKGTITNDDKNNIKEAMLRMREPYKNLVIKDDIDNMEDTISDIVSCKQKPDIIIDDFIQLINVSGIHTGKRYEIEDVLKKYHWLMKRYGFSTVLASQLSRAVEQRQFDNEPRISDLAEASFIEQLSENVILLWWEYKFLGQHSELRQDEIKFIFGKTRFGSTGYEIINIDEKTGRLC